MPRDKGIVLALYPLRETSSIAVICMEWGGLLRGVARQHRKAQGPWSGVLDLFSELDLDWQESSRSELKIFNEGVLINPYLKIREDWFKFQVASYWAKLILKTIEPGVPVPGIFDLLQRAYTYLEKKTPTVKAIIHFENELATLHGIGNLGVEKSSFADLEELFGYLPVAERNQIFDALRQK